VCSEFQNLKNTMLILNAICKALLQHKTFPFPLAARTAERVCYARLTRSRRATWATGQPAEALASHCVVALRKHRLALYGPLSVPAKAMRIN
jgi:hypothetical protein